jgi:trehalose-6-phosphate synthase
MKIVPTFEDFVNKQQESIQENHLNEELHDFVKDVQSAIGKNNSVQSVLDYLGRRLSKEEYAALIKAGVMKGRY